ncbi:MAG: hypothetical protein IE925_15025 [Rhodobacterales bacterium]|nr:hypothetical protein [Rhodobacterales bacterium]
MTEQELVYNAMPGTVAEIMERTGLTEYRVRAEIINLRHRDVRIEGVGPLNASRVYHARDPLPDQRAPMPKKAPKAGKNRKKAKPKRVARPSVGKTARQRPRQLFRLPDAPLATLAQERAVTAETITRDCLKCRKPFETTRHGPRYCPPCRASMLRHE